MNTPQLRPDRNPIHFTDEDLADLRRSVDLITGAVALLDPARSGATINADLARLMAQESRAVASLVLDRIDQRLALRHEAERARGQTAKSISSAVQR